MGKELKHFALHVVHPFRTVAHNAVKVADDVAHTFEKRQTQEALIGAAGSLCGYTEVEAAIQHPTAGNITLAVLVVGVEVGLLALAIPTGGTSEIAGEAVVDGVVLEGGETTGMVGSNMSEKLVPVSELAPTADVEVFTTEYGAQVAKVPTAPQEAYPMVTFSSEEGTSYIVPASDVFAESSEFDAPFEATVANDAEYAEVSEESDFLSRIRSFARSRGWTATGLYGLTTIMGTYATDALNAVPHALEAAQGALEAGQQINEYYEEGKKFYSQFKQHDKATATVVRLNFAEGVTVPYSYKVVDTTDTQLAAYRQMVESQNQALKTLSDEYGLPHV